MLGKLSGRGYCPRGCVRGEMSSGQCSTVTRRHPATRRTFSSCSSLSCSTFVKRQWLDRRSVRPERLCVMDKRSTTNSNLLESYHSRLRRRTQVSHPILFSLLTYFLDITTDNMVDMAHIRNGIPINRPKKKRNIKNNARIKDCIDRYESGAYTRLQFLTAMSRSLVGALHIDAFHADADSIATTTTPTNVTGPQRRVHPMMPSRLRWQNVVKFV